MKKYLFLITICSSLSLFSQTTTKEKKTKGRLYGGLESNSQWYLNDVERGINHPEQPFRSNNYLLLNYNYGKWTTGIQGESYAPKPLLNFNPKYEKTNLGTYYLTYKSTLSGYKPKFILSGRLINDQMPEYIVKVLLKKINILNKNFGNYDIF